MERFSSRQRPFSSRTTTLADKANGLCEIAAPLLAKRRRDTSVVIHDTVNVTVFELLV
jgi:hypothetical protein